MIILKDNFGLTIKFNGKEYQPTSPESIRHLSITESLDAIAPTLEFIIPDMYGYTTQLVPIDGSCTPIEITLVKPANERNKNDYVKEYSFDIYDKVASENYVKYSGILDIPNIFRPEYTRGFGNKTIYDHLVDIAENEFGIKEANTDISGSLKYKKTFIQPDWTNQKLLFYLRDTISGSGNESGYYCFIKNEKQYPVFAFKSINDILLSDVKRTFINVDPPPKDMTFIHSYNVTDNTKTFLNYGSTKQNYDYFNYNTGSLVSSTFDAVEQPSLTDYHLIDNNDDGMSTSIGNLGRSTDYSPDFRGVVEGSYKKRLYSLSNMDILVDGSEDVCPGDLVKLVFASGAIEGNYIPYQYNGVWIVHTVVHHLTNMEFYTTLKLIRSGIDYYSTRTLIKSNNQIRK